MKKIMLILLLLLSGCTYQVNEGKYHYHCETSGLTYVHLKEDVDPNSWNIYNIEIDFMVVTDMYSEDDFIYESNLLYIVDKQDNATSLEEISKLSEASFLDLFPMLEYQDYTTKIETESEYRFGFSETKARKTGWRGWVIDTSDRLSHFVDNSYMGLNPDTAYYTDDSCTLIKE